MQLPGDVYDVKIFKDEFKSQEESPKRIIVKAHYNIHML